MVMRASKAHMHGCQVVAITAAAAVAAVKHLHSAAVSALAAAAVNPWLLKAAAALLLGPTRTLPSAAVRPRHLSGGHLYSAAVSALAPTPAKDSSTSTAGPHQRHCH